MHYVYLMLLQIEVCSRLIPVINKFMTRNEWGTLQYPGFLMKPRTVRQQKEKRP